MSDSAHTWFESHLSSCIQVVKLGSVLSDPLPLMVGVSQGSILGPVLFTLYVNELLSAPKNCQTMGYVYDTKILLSLSPCNVSEALDTFNSGLKEVSSWFCVNLTGALSPPPIYLLGKQIYPSSVVKDLEVWIDSNLTYDEHISKLSSISLYKSRLATLNTCSIEIDLKQKNYKTRDIPLSSESNDHRYHRI